jgi:hypothetical protein
MKFVLTYDGELRSNDVRQKWEIRKHLAPQLKELWQIDPTLQQTYYSRRLPTVRGYFVSVIHHSADDQREPDEEKTGAPLPPGWGGASINVCEPIARGGRTFFPLVRETLGLKCALKVLFLRKEPPGRVYQGGDLDNRLKTLFDALAIPTVDQIIPDQTIDDPIHCLLEDDALISGVSVETHQLLSKPASSAHEVRLVIEVEVRVAKARPYNLHFMGT